MGSRFVTLTMTLLAIIIACQSPIKVAALSDAQANVLNGKILHYDTEVNASCGLGGGPITGLTTGTSDGSVWQSGLQPPYILEQFAIETLKDVAKKMGTTPDKTVTEEHVIALVAFMVGEGGDINNLDLFNPLNTGLNAPELINGAQRGDGVQSFKSFDAGVEATARTITGSFQSRLAATLVNQTSTAIQFMGALTYYNRYPGNDSWASASRPPNASSYYRERLQLVQQVKNQYADLAGLVVGTPELEQVKNITNKAKLVYHPSADKSPAADTAIAGGGGRAGDSVCSGDAGPVLGSLVSTALNLAWDTPKHGKQMTDAKPSYQSAMPKFNGSTGLDEWSDCGVFTSTAIISSGADTNFPKRVTFVQQDYMKNHPEKYQARGLIKVSSELQPGDILVNSSHTFLFVGPQANGFNSVSASQHDHVPEATNFYDDGFYGYRIIK